MRRLIEAIGAVLDRRLLAESPRPLAVALSGGGDSLALLLATADWARRHDRPLLVLTVDHRLQPQGAAWAEACAAHAARLGAAFERLDWEGPKPAQGVPAAARAARHALLADAARAAGARVILMGHTADDVAEAALMREEGATTPAPREWAPSPVWPEGRDIFLLRPMLRLGRAELRDWLAERGETWIEDPANDDSRFARTRARRRLSGAPTTPPCPAAPDSDLARTVFSDRAGALQASRPALRVATPEMRARLIAAACLSAAGTARPPRTDRLERLVQALTGEGAVSATLCGAKITADEAYVVFTREAGRGGLASVRLRAGQTQVWDGRFELTAFREGLTAQPLAGLATRLSPAERRTLAGLPAASRGALPAVTDATGQVFCPVLQDGSTVAARALALPRLLAACGAVDREPAA